MGGSHCARMVDELDETCLDVVDISVRGWRLTDSAVDEKVRELTEIVSRRMRSAPPLCTSCLTTAVSLQKKMTGEGNFLQGDRMVNSTLTGSWKLQQERM